MAQVFHASANDTFTSPNGAVGYRPGGPMDCLGPYAKVKNCPVYRGKDDTGKRLTCYATGYADTFFSIPACTRYRRKHVRGYFTHDDDGVRFQVMDSHKHLFD
jgi:hypothetical protein